LQVPESGDDVKAVGGGVAAAAVLPQYLPVFGPGDDVFNGGRYSMVCSVVVVADDAGRCGRAGAW
jgi:hypothetical protein